MFRALNCPAAAAASSSQAGEVQAAGSCSDVAKGTEVSAGLILVAPNYSTNTYLIDREGRTIRVWHTDYTPALSTYLLPNGHLLRSGAMP